MKNTATLVDRFDSDLAAGPEEAASAPAQVLRKERVAVAGHEVWRITGEFWTSGQRRASPIHEVSYRACFKPQLPGYFIKRFTQAGDLVYDPFSGRGTTAIEAALRNRRVAANDVNPLSAILARPRLLAPALADIEARLAQIPRHTGARAEVDLSMFYDRRTESEIVSLRDYLEQRRRAGSEDALDAWIRMVATNRLTGHSRGFFSVYSFPPNQAVSAAAQTKINAHRRQTPAYKDTQALILAKSRQLLGKLTDAETRSLRAAGATAQFLSCDARETRALAANSVQLTVTSPPFLDVVQYADDNWLRCWFNNLPAAAIAERITMTRTLAAWEEVMGGVFVELYRITRPGGVVAFEVGEVRRGKVKLDEHVMPLGVRAGFACEAVLINAQAFTKTANIWGVTNNTAGTNTNRIVLFRKTPGRRHSSSDVSSP